MVIFLRNVEIYVSYFEKYFIVVLLSLMILLSFGSIVLRNTGISIPSWVSSFTQYLVFWVAFIGASLASAKNRHVNINLISSFLNKYPGFLRIISIITNFVVILLSSVLCAVSYLFIRSEYVWGIDIPSMGMPSWIFESVIVYTFFMISFKYFVRFLEILTKKTLFEETS